MRNAVYGKTMENLRDRIDVKFVRNKKDFLKWTSKPSYMLEKIFHNDLVAIRKNKVALTLNKSAYNGMCILELSKVLMYELHDDYIKSKYGNKSRLLITDTDSLMYEIKIEDVYEDFSNDKEMFDFSNDETAGVAIEKFVGLKPKIYSCLADDNSEHRRE